MESIRIRDIGDPRIADYRNLKDAQLASDRDRFIVEGRGNLRVLLDRSRFAPDSILLGERAWKALAEELEARILECPVYVSDRVVLDEIVGFPIHRGVLAACPRGPESDPVEVARALLGNGSAARIVALEGLTNHDNVGGIFRNAMGLGAGAVLLCDRSCDPLYRKAIRTSMGGSLCVPFARASPFVDVLRELKTKGFVVLALDPGKEGIDLASLDPMEIGPAVLLVGTEGEGLTEQALEVADQRVRIGMEAGVDSLNVAVAAAIALHRLRQDDIAGTAPSRRPDR